MTVGKLNRKDHSSPDDFISKGGSSALEGNGDSKPDEEVRMTFRCPKHLIEALDDVRKTRPGRVSRNQAIVEGLSVYLESIRQKEGE